VPFYLQVPRKSNYLRLTISILVFARTSCYNDDDMRNLHCMLLILLLLPACRRSVTAPCEPIDKSNRSMSEAVQNRNIVEKEELLASRSSDDAACQPDGRALYEATRKGNLELLRLLLARGADPNAVAESGYSALSHAVSAGNAEMVRLLITYGADVTVRDNPEWSLLHTAADTGNLDILEILVTEGVDPDIRGYDEMTPLHVVALRGPFEAADKLVDLGADVNACDIHGRTPADAAIESGNEYMPALLYSLGGRAAKTPPQDINEAAKYGFSEDVREFLKQGQSTELRDDDNMTPLHHAAHLFDTELAGILIAHGANVNATSTKGILTPLHIAAGNADIEFAGLLIANGADVNAGYPVCTPLNFAREEEMRESLRRHGAVPSQKLKDDDE
jgi:ankyrin repeat protein